MKSKFKYLTSAFLLLSTSVIVKIIGAVYKIPLTSFIGAVGRGYFAAAYNLYLPLHAIIMGAFPIALSRLTSKYNACQDRRMLSSLIKGGRSVFFFTGTAGMIVLLIAAKPYSEFIASSPKSIYTVLVLAPSLLFSCLASTYRGYFEGFMNMVPTSVSQTIEAVFKLVFGLLFAKLSMAYLYQDFAADHIIFHTVLQSDEEALSFIYPFTSASAMLGVSLGSAISYLYLWIYYRIHRDKTLPLVSGKEGRNELLQFSLPIVTSCAVQSVFQFLDTASIQYALGSINTQTLKNVYGQFIALAGVTENDITTYVYGLFSTSLDFKNLIPGITMALGVCAVPAICREYEYGSREKLTSLMNNIYKYTCLLSLFLGLYLALCSREVLQFFYGGSSQDIVDSCDSLVKYFSVSAPIYSLASTAVFCVQAVGKPEKSIMPYVVSGAVRVILNLLLVRNEMLILFGAVISGAAGYLILFVMNARIAAKVSGAKFDLMNGLIKPIFIGGISFILSRFLFSSFFVTNFVFVNLLIKFIVFSIIFCMLCFLLKVLNFREVFFMFQSKKNGLNT